MHVNLRMSYLTPSEHGCSGQRHMPAALLVSQGAVLQPLLFRNISGFENLVQLRICCPWQHYWQLVQPWSMSYLIPEATLRLSCLTGMDASTPRGHLC